MGHLTFCFLSIFAAVSPVLSDSHSLYYIYTALSKPVNLPNIYEFTALGLLDDREIDYYNSKDQVKTPRQDWMKEKMQQDYWEKGTQSRKSKEQWFKVNVDILMDRMRHNKTDLHVLQWRHGCEIEEMNGQVKFMRGIDEYSYDGGEFLSFDAENMRWIAPVSAAEATKRKWDDVRILNEYTKGYLQKECVEWLQKFMTYGEEMLKKHRAPKVHAFAKRCVNNPSKLTLTCLATGFFPKDVRMNVRKYRTSLPEHLVKSSGVRPNDDDTYQLRLSVDIEESEKAHYDCYVSHRSLEKPITMPWDYSCNDCEQEKVQSGLIGGIVGVVVTLLVTGVILIILKQKRRICAPSNKSKKSIVVEPKLFPPPNGMLSTPLNAPPAKSPDGQAPSNDQENSPMLEKARVEKSNLTESKMSVESNDSGAPSDKSKGSNNVPPPNGNGQAPSNDQENNDEATPMLEKAHVEKSNRTESKVSVESEDSGLVDGEGSSRPDGQAPSNDQENNDEATPMLENPPAEKSNRTESKVSVESKDSENLPV